jgi:HPt (histidine-containing phosphotransfer) domain-containing protein
MVGNDDPAYLREMLTVFWDSMADTPDTIRVMTRNRDSRSLVQAAHAAKGAAASACATALADLCKRLEHAARTEQWSEIEDLSPEIADAFDEIEDFVTAQVGPGSEKQSA